MLRGYFISPLEKQLSFLLELPRIGNLFPLCAGFPATSR